MKHLHKWIESLVAKLDEEVDEKTRRKIMEACGRTCIPQSFVRTARACWEEARDEDDFLDRLREVWEHLKKKGEATYVVYEKCYCPLVKGHPGKLSPTFCDCSRGWIKELFESVLGRRVEVKVLSTIAKGDSVCKFEVCL